MERLVTSLLVINLMAVAQSPESAHPTATTAALSKPPIEILDFKIASDYYPMLDRKSSEYTADNPDFPRTETERMAGQSARRRTRTEDSKSQGKLRSTVKIISEANLVELTIRNTGSKTIKTVGWDFAFPRYVNEQIILRYDVTGKTEIKPGGKKTLKQSLPAGATRCKIIGVRIEDSQPDKAKIFEAVCGPGINDPSYLKQETVTIKRIEYNDGMVWQREKVN